MLCYETFSQTIEQLGTSGILLTPEQKSAFQSSLVLLKQQNKFKHLYLWGRITCLDDDYFIAFGCNQNQFDDRKFFYTRAREESDGLIVWKLLRPATDEARVKAKSVVGRFQGDPSHEYSYSEILRTGEGDDIQEEEQIHTMKEEERLAVVIEEITKNSIVVPRGSFVQLPTTHVVRNRTWEGLSIQDAAKPSSYCLFRKAERLNNADPIQRATMNKSIDFMDSLEDEIPSGKWVIQFDRGSGLVVVKNLEWLGYSFFHLPGTAQFGSLYFGTGERNPDLPFML